MNRFLIREIPLTLVAAKQFDGYISMAADSKRTYAQDGLPTLAESVPKLQHLSQILVAWAFSGSGDVGIEFNRWMLEYQWNPSMKWQAFCDCVLTELNRRNRDKRRSMRKSGMKPKDNDVCEVLIGGYIDKIPNILHLNSDGGYRFYDKGELAVIGSGADHARMASITLEDFYSSFVKKPMPQDEDFFRFVVYEGANRDPQSSVPLHYVKITQDGVSEY